MPKNKNVDKNDRHIVVAMGGSIAPSAPALLKYVFNLADSAKPNVLFINTATGDHPDSLTRSLSFVERLPCNTQSLSFFARTPPDLERLLFDQDVIVIGGGNTKSMLAVWREYCLDDILKDAWKRGIILCGSSAGGICWFDACVTDSWDESYTALPALGFLSGSCCPHYDGEAGRRDCYHSLIEDGQLEDGIAIDEQVGVHYINKKRHTVVTGREGATAYLVEEKKGEIIETPLEAKLLKPVT